MNPTCGSDGSAKPIEVARALGLAGSDEPGAPRCALARLGFAVVDGAPEVAVDVPLVSLSRRVGKPATPVASVD